MTRDERRKNYDSDHYPRIVLMLDNGVCLETIRDIYNREKVPTLYGGPWSKNALVQIVSGIEGPYKKGQARKYPPRV